MNIGTFTIERNDGAPLQDDDLLEAAMDLISYAEVKEETQDAVFYLLAQDGRFGDGPPTDPFIRTDVGRPGLASLASSIGLLACVAAVLWSVCCLFTERDPVEACRERGHSESDCEALLR